VSQYLTNFASLAAGYESPALSAATERIHQLEYFLKQEQAATAELSRELGYAEDMLKDAREIIDRRDEQLSQVDQKIRNLEKCRVEVRRDCRHVRDSIARLERSLEDPRENPPIASRSSSRAPATTASSAGHQCGKTCSELQNQINKLKGELAASERRASSAEVLTSLAQNREQRLANKGGVVLRNACKSAFIAGFERCRRWVEGLLPIKSASHLAKLTVDSSDPNLMAVMEDNANSFRQLALFSSLDENSYWRDQSTQTDESNSEF
jgi:hypothetical protein